MLSSTLLLPPLALWAGMVAAAGLGRWLGRRAGRDEDADRAGLGAIDGAIFALLGLLIAFTFSGAAARFDERRELGVAEANALSTAWLRLQALDEPVRRELRALLAEYVGSRVDTYAALPDEDAAWAGLARSKELGPRLFGVAVEACRDEPMLRGFVLPPLNETLDLLTSRTMALYHHPPRAVVGLLMLLSVVSAFLAGWAAGGSRRAVRLHVLGYATIVALAVGVILDFEYPRRGLIQVTQVDLALQELHADMLRELSSPADAGDAAR